MHKVAIYLRHAYQSPNHRPRWSLVLTIDYVMFDYQFGTFDLLTYCHSYINFICKTTYCYV